MGSCSNSDDPDDEGMPHTSALMNHHTYSIPGMVYTPVELGTIRLGHLEERLGKQTPIKDDKFTITRLVKQRGQWIPHPLHQELLDKLPPPAAAEGAAERKLREIPIRIMFDDPDLTVRSRYEAFEVQRKRPVCGSTTAGKARRLVGASAEEVECVGPEECAFAHSEGVRCKLFGRVVVQIEGQTESDNGFMLRSTSVNTLRNFEAKLRRYWALFGKRLKGVPFRLVLRAKTTASSFWRPFYFVDLELATGVTLQAAAAMARDHEKANQDAGLDVAAWEDMVRSGLNNGALAATDIEAEMMAEFFTVDGQGEDGEGAEDPPKGKGAVPLVALASPLSSDRPSASDATSPMLSAGQAPQGAFVPLLGASEAPEEIKIPQPAEPGAVAGMRPPVQNTSGTARQVPPVGARVAVSQHPPRPNRNGASALPHSKPLT